MAAGSSRPSSWGSTGRPRRSGIARLRRSSSGASSRKVNGRPFRISCASTDGSVVSRTTTVTRPDSIAPTSSARPSMSMASRRQSSSVWRTRTWSGISSGPGATFSWQAARVGKTAAIRSSASIRWIAGGFFFPPRIRSTARDRFRFHLHRAANIGEVRTACRTTPSTVLEARNLGTRSSGKLCCGPRDSRMASSLAAACSSKSNVTQNRLRRASPRARLRRAPNGACPTSCIPPLSSKNRSRTMVSMSGSSPSWARAVAR